MKGDMNDRIKELEERVARLEANQGQGSEVSQSDLDEILKKLKEVENELKNKVDCDLFDNEIAALRAMIGEMDQDPKSTQIQTTAPPPRPSGPQLTTKELNRIKEIIEKFPIMEDTQ